jgi:hypothetical protein
MTTILYKDGQFQTEDGIPFENHNDCFLRICDLYQKDGEFKLTDGFTYFIGEKVEVVDQYKELPSGYWKEVNVKEWNPAWINERRKVARIIEEKEPTAYFSPDPSGVGGDWVTGSNNRNIEEKEESEEAKSNVLEVVGNFLHSSGLVFHTDDADHVGSDLIRYLEIEGYTITRKQ